MRSCITAVFVVNGCLTLAGLKHTCDNHTWISSKLALIRLFPIAVHSPALSLAPVSSVARPLRIRLDTRRVVPFCSRLHSRAGRMAELTKADTLSLFGGVLPSTNLLKGAQTQQAQSSRGQKNKAGLQERPPKFQKPNNSKGKGKGKSKEKRQREESEPSSEHSLESSLIPLVAQLCLRHEDSINILRMDKAYVMLFKTSGEETMLPTIHDLGVRWSELQAAKQTDCAKHCVDQRRGDGAADKSQGPVGERRQGQAVDQDGVDHKARGSRARVASSDLERRTAEGSAVPGCRATPSFGCTEGFGHSARACLRPDRTALSSDPQASRGVRGRNHGVQAGDKPEGQGGDDGARSTGSALQLSPLAVGGRANAPGRAETVGHGEEATTAAARQVLALALYNSGNSCYQNAFVMSWLWAIVQAHHRQVGGCIDDRLGRCFGLINTLLSGKIDRLTKVFAWSAIMQQWPRPQHQHDIGEFAMHALPKLRTSLMQGSWFARKGVPFCHDVDTGPLHQPVLMAIPNGASTIQACVEAWSHQDDVHALGCASPLILVQLGRFRHRSHRRVRKFKGEVGLAGIIHMPIYTGENSLELTYAPYRVIAGAYHLGNTPASGHYQCMLYEASPSIHSVEAHPNAPVVYSTDDGRTPRPCNNAEHDDALKNMYLVWLMKC